MLLHPTSASGELVFTRDLNIPGDRAALYREVARGRLVRLTAGAYLDAAAWADALPEDRHRAVLAAVARMRPDEVFGGVSAAIAWHRPLLGPPPARPEVIVHNAGGGRSRRSTCARTTNVPFDVVHFCGLRVTTLARSLVDAARVSSTARAVAMLDHAMSGARSDEPAPASARVTIEDLLAELELGSPRGSARARTAIEFADGAAGSPGESWSRVLIDRLRFPRPVLQQEFRDADGLIGYVDFWWPEFGVIGEFDGEGKYRREKYTRGRDTASIVVDEKVREDRLRAIVGGVARWGWDDLREPSRLSRKLEVAGLRHGR